MPAREVINADWKSFDWSSINLKEDAVGLHWQENEVYILKGFRLNPDKYQHIHIKVPAVLITAIRSYQSDGLGWD